MIPADEHAKRTIAMLSTKPNTKKYKKDLDMLKAIDNCYASNVYGGSIFLPIGSSDKRGALRHKPNNLEKEVKELSVNYLYGGGYYELKHIQHNPNDVIESEAGAMFSDIFILVDSVEDLHKMQQIKVQSDISAEKLKNQQPILMEDLEMALNGYGRIIEYRVYSSDFHPEHCKIERVKEGKFKNGKMDGYARKFTGLKGGNCFVGYFKEGKPDGKLEVIDKDGYIIKHGVYNDSECIKEIEIQNYTTRLIKTGKDATRGVEKLDLPDKKKTGPIGKGDAVLPKDQTLPGEIKPKVVKSKAPGMTSGMGMGSAALGGAAVGGIAGGAIAKKSLDTPFEMPLVNPPIKRFGINNTHFVNWADGRWYECVLGGEVPGNKR